MDPVFSRLPNERTLIASSTRVSLHRMTAGAHKIIQLGQLDDKCIPVVFVKWPLLQVILDEC